MNTKQVLASIVLATGMFVSFGSALIPRWVPEEQFWNEQQAEEQGLASTRLHKATFESAKVQEDDKATDEEKTHAAQQLAAAQERFDHSRASLQRAQFWHKTVPKILRWSGAAIALLGVIGLLAFQPQD